VGETHRRMGKIQTDYEEVNGRWEHFEVFRDSKWRY
jgi:hypothetical protein